MSNDTKKQIRKKKAERQYLVVKYSLSPDRWAIINRGDKQQRPVGEQLYTYATHAHRARRELERNAQEIDEMIKRDGAISL